MPKNHLIFSRKKKDSKDQLDEKKSHISKPQQKPVVAVTTFVILLTVLLLYLLWARRVEAIEFDWGDGLRRLGERDYKVDWRNTIEWWTNKGAHFGSIEVKENQMFTTQELENEEILVIPQELIISNPVLPFTSFLSKDLRKVTHFSSTLIPKAHLALSIFESLRKNSDIYFDALFPGERRPSLPLFEFSVIELKELGAPISLIRCLEDHLQVFQYFQEIFVRFYEKNLDSDLLGWVLINTLRGSIIQDESYLYLPFIELFNHTPNPTSIVSTFNSTHWILKTKENVVLPPILPINFNLNNQLSSAETTFLWNHVPLLQNSFIDVISPLKLETISKMKLDLFLNFNCLGLHNYNLFLETKFSCSQLTLEPTSKILNCWRIHILSDQDLVNFHQDLKSISLQKDLELTTLHSLSSHISTYLQDNSKHHSLNNTQTTHSSISKLLDDLHFNEEKCYFHLLELIQTYQQTL